MTSIAVTVSPAVIYLHPGDATPEVDYTIPFNVADTYPGTINITVVSLLPDEATSFAEPVTMGINARAEIQIGIVAQQTPGQLDLGKRLVPGVVLTLPTPAIINGKPMLPPYHAFMSSTMTVTEGAHHVHTITDPGPPPDGSTPPDPIDSGYGRIRWTVDSLPDPSGYPGGYYWLGTPSSADGTSGIESGAQQWAAVNGSDPVWNSVFPFKPSVRKHVWYGPDGNIETFTKAVRFNTFYIEHMWTDLVTMNSPFSWIIIGVIMQFDTQDYTHTLLDSGKAPSASGISWNASDVYKRATLHADPDAYRTAMRVNQTRYYAFNDMTAGSRAIITPFHHAYKPRMFFHVNDGTNSYAGNFGTASHRIKKGTMLDHGNQRYLTLGRKNGVLSRETASHMSVFEIRYFDHALTPAQLDEQYDQLSSTWKFHKYT